MTSLKSLSLNLECCDEISSNGFFDLFDSFPQLSFLEILNLRIRGNEYLDHLTPVILFENLQGLGHFQELSLDVLGCRSVFGDCFAIGLDFLDPSRLRKLSIGFCLETSNQNLSDFFTVLQEFSSLTHLDLNFD